MTDVDEAPEFYSDSGGSSEVSSYSSSIGTSSSGEIGSPLLYVSDAEGERLTVRITSQVDALNAVVSLFTIASYDDGESATDAYKLSVSGLLSVGTYAVTITATEASRYRL